MSVTFPPASVQPGEEQVVFRRISWDAYEKLNDELGEGRNPRMIYCDGKLTIMVTSRKHDWYAERLGQMIVALASALRIPWEDAGQATFRRKGMSAGLEGDKTYYLAEHAKLMKGSRNLDLDVQPPPDLAIEVEVSHPADSALAAWGRLGVPEVWRFDPVGEQVGFCLRCKDESYSLSKRSLAFPFLTTEDVLEQMLLADKIGAWDWYDQLGEWVQSVVLPRLKGDRE
jgi:Uma2 family endonuclease